jgi:hypothetical protein
VRLFRGDSKPFVFVSYRRRDLDAVRALADGLDAALGEDHVFFDLADIHAGARWESLLHTQLLASDVLLAAISERWMSELEARDHDSDFVVREISLALQEGIPVVPVLFPGVEIPAMGQLPPLITGILGFQAISLSHSRWAEDLQTLVAALEDVPRPQDSSTRKRKRNEAKAMAAWFPSAEPNEIVLARVAGTRESDPVLILSDRRLLITRPDAGSDSLETQASELYAVRDDDADLWIIGKDFERHLRRVDPSATERFLEQLKMLDLDLDQARGEPNSGLWLRRRIDRARAHLEIDDDLFATGGDKEGGAVLLIRPDESVIVRRKERQFGVVTVPHDVLGALCVERRAVWLLSPAGEQHIDNIPPEDLDELIVVLRKLAPNAQLHRKRPDREVRESLMMLDPSGLAASNGIDLSWTTRLRPTPEEAIVLAISKLHVMESDLESDPDWDDRVEKRKTIEAFVGALCSAFAGEVDEDSKPVTSMSSLTKCIRSESWADRVRATIGGMDPEDARRVLLDRGFLESILTTVARRDRALVLLVEMASFYPWTKKVKFEQGTRERVCRDIAELMPASVGSEDFDLIDRQLKERAKDLGRQGVNWKRLVPLIVGGTAIGIITGGAAAPLIGTAIGGTMGLSGAAATSAGLALLGGGSMAAGGLGMAGGMALIGTLGGVVGAGAGLTGNKAIDMSREALLTESVKLDLLADLVLLAELKEARQVATVIELLDAQTEQLSEHLRELEVDRGGPDTGLTHRLRKNAVDTVKKAGDEVEDLKDRLSILDGLRQALARQLTTFIDATSEWIAEGSNAVEAIKESAGPSLLLAIQAGERAAELAERFPRIIPALITNVDGKPVGTVLVEVMSGEVDVQGEDALRVRGVKNELFVEGGGVLLDVIAHPLVWAAAAAAFGGAQAASSKALAEAMAARGFILPAGMTIEWLQRAGLAFSQLAKAVATILERELKEVAGGAAIDLAEGLRIELVDRGSSAKR